MPTIPVPDVDPINAAFGGGAMKILPPMAEIPAEFKRWSGGSKWNKVVSDWFLHGIENATWTPKTGVDVGKALRALRCCIGSFEPAHEHKEAGCAYLMSQWFEDVKYTAGKANR